MMKTTLTQVASRLHGATTSTMTTTTMRFASSRSSAPSFLVSSSNLHTNSKQNAGSDTTASIHTKSMTPSNHVKKSGTIHIFDRSFASPAAEMVIDGVTSSSTPEAEYHTSSSSAEAYKRILESNTNVNWKMDANQEEILDLIITSFAGSEDTDPEPVFEWALRGIVPTKFNQDRRDLYKYMLTIFSEETWEHEHIAFGHGTSSTSSSKAAATSIQKDTESLASSIVLAEFDPQVEFYKSTMTTMKENIRDVVRLLKDAARGNLPRPLQNISNLMTLASRAVPLKEQILEAHKVYGPQEAHMYVKIVATDPSFQGQGLGKQLMTQLEDLADATGKSCYLECAGERNPIFYEKFGFRTVHELKLCEDGEDSTEVLYLMVREPQVQGVDERED